MAVVEKPWGDRLAEVWASPGNAGAGVVVGERGVLIARHVVAAALEAEDGSILCRVVRPGSETARWVPMRDVWGSAEWDLALLEVDPDVDEAGTWLAPSSSMAIVELGSSSEAGCEAVGFPESAVQQGQKPDYRVRQSEQVVGRVLPVGQGKPAVNPTRALPPRWMPFDVETATPGTQEGWGGMSGAGVVLPDGRLIGVVVTAEAEHQERRLYLVPLASVLEQAEGFDERLGEITGQQEVAEARDGPMYRAVLQADCLGADGRPLAVEDVQELNVFGVKPADLPGEPTYLDYVPRDDDGELEKALREAIETQRMLLVVGSSAAGKSRSTARVARELLAQHRLFVPKAGRLSDVVELHLVRTGPVLVWLDDVQNHAHAAALSDTLKTLASAGAIVVGTVRRLELEALAPDGDLRNPAGAALTDPKLVRRVDWLLKWSEEERARLTEHVKYPALLEAAARGTPVGAYCVAGPDLVQKLHDARMDEDRPCRYALVRAVLDWTRTGIGQPVPLAEATKLMPAVGEIHGMIDPNEMDDALKWATTGVIGATHRTSQALITLDESRTLQAHDYLIDADARNNPAIPPDPVWTSALERATEDGSFAIGAAAHEAGLNQIAVKAMKSLAEAGWLDAMSNLGVLLEESDPEAARGWFERAAEAGHEVAMSNLGALLEESDPEAAHGWYERAAEAGDAAAMNNLGVRLAESDPEAAQGWYERAAEAGDTNAMFNLGVLSEESEPETARAWFERAAKVGEARAMFNLGALSEASDPEAARGWFERAAEAGHEVAMSNLGALLEESDPEAAHGWYERAAEAGDASAMNNLGVRLAESDPEAARGWYERAAETGMEVAMSNLGALLAESDPEAARGWFERAAEAGDADAMSNLGALLAESDPEAARNWWERAAEAGEARAMFNLGVLSEESDPEATRNWWERAAEAGQADAMLNLGVLLLESDPEKAWDWFERAADAGQAGAMRNLGVLLEESDPEAARGWFERAAEAGDADAMLRLGLLFLESDPEAAQGWFDRASELLEDGDP